MPTMHTYDYAVVRVVPRVERGEFVNVGVIVSCDATDSSRRGSSSTPSACWRSTRAPTSTRSAPRSARSMRVCAGGAARRRDRRSCRRASASTGWWRRAAPSSRPRRCTPGAPTTPGAVIDHLFETMVGGPRRAANPGAELARRASTARRRPAADQAKRRTRRLQRDGSVAGGSDVAPGREALAASSRLPALPRRRASRRASTGSVRPRLPTAASERASRSAQPRWSGWTLRPAMARIVNTPTLDDEVERGRDLEDVAHRHGVVPRPGRRRGRR